MLSKLEDRSLSMLDVMTTRERRDVRFRTPGRNLSWSITVALLLATLGALTSLPADEFRGVQFIAWTALSGFETSVSHDPPACVLVSSEIQTSILWDELIPSWNLDARSSVGLKIEVRPIFDLAETRFYTLGLWSAATNEHPRKSVAKQEDAHATVMTDTLVLKQRSHRLQLRLTVCFLKRLLN